MANTRKLKDDNKKIVGNVQKQYENLFSKQDEPPAPSVREVEALKGRVVELERTLEKQQQAGVNLSSPVISTESISFQLEALSSTAATAKLPSPEPAQRQGGFFRDLLRAPKFGNPAKDRIAGLQHNILMGLFLTSVSAIIITLMFWTEADSQRAIGGLGILILAIFICGMAFFWQRRGHIERTSWTLVGLMYLVFILSFPLSGYTFPIALLLALAISLAGLLLPYYSVIAVTIFSLVIVWVFPYISSLPVQIKINELGYTSGILVLEGLLLTAASRTLKQSFAEADRSTQDLRRANGELQTLTTNLEQRVARRTRDLELASEVGRTITGKIADLDEMLRAAVEIICARFELYYTQVYLTDATDRSIILHAGTGEVGEELLQRGHRLLIGPGSLNGRAAAQKKAVIVADTLQNPSFMPNALLPHTRSEMAVPLIVGNRVIGVLDMQSEQPGMLNEINLPAFEVLAGQLAIAIQNASLFKQAEESRLEVEAQARRLTTSGWQKFLNAVERSEKIGYVYNQKEVLPLVETEALAASENNLVVPIEITGANLGEIRLVDEADREWTEAETEIVRATISQIAHRIESLRLLADAERYRIEAEQVLRRLTSEGWNEYLKTRRTLEAGYVYDQNQVQPLGENRRETSLPVLSRLLTVREETIGEITVDADENKDPHAADLMVAVAQQLSDHIENLRLLEETEQKRREAQSLSNELIRRASQLETVAALSSTASTVLDPEVLLQDIVDLAKERFNLYHAHIYLVDSSWGTLLLASGAGSVGRQMVADEHSIAIDAQQSLVARAAREQKAVTSNDVLIEEGFLPNPLLPNTRSEMAVPLIVGGSVLGVFDVQSDRLDGFSKEDADIYTTLAAQLAVALQNARLYSEQAATVTQLRELDRLKSSFLANMSHELRTPLNSILGFSDVMLAELDGPLTENMNTDLGLIHKNGQHLLHLINDVLDMAKIDAGRMNLNPERFKLHEVLDEVTSITSTLASEKNLSLFIEKNSDEKVEIYADRTRLRQVMINLVNNAIKFTEKGKIALCVKQLDSTKVLISVKDTGLGIPPEQLETVFQEFMQVDTSSTRKVGGTGLGLPISRRLVEMHGGRVWVESTGVAGKGSTFYVELPLEVTLTEIIKE